MKKQFIKTALWLALGATSTLGFVACNNDDNGGGGTTILVEDGFYIKGAGTALTELDAKGMMTTAKNEVLQTDRANLKEIYVAVKAGSAGFNIVEVAGKTTKTYGPGTDFAVVAEAARNVDEPKVDFWRGSYKESTTPFTVPSDGLYQVVIDKELMKVAVIPVAWGAIGSATPGGWGESTQATASAFDLNKMTWTINEITLIKSDWKLRNNNGWKVILDENLDLGSGNKGVKVNTNFGGAINALAAGGGNFVNDKYGIYKLVITWELGKTHTLAVTWVKDGEPLPEYPADLYMIGDGVGDWVWANTDLKMIPVNSHPEAFWKIVWMNETGSFKMAPVKDWKGDFGCSDDTKKGEIDFKKGTTNIPVPGVAGYYMVWVDLKKDSISITKPEVYLIGDAVGSWDAAVAANKFTVDNTNSVLTITKTLSAGNLRMHAWHKWHGDWWQSEFNVIDGKIEFRGTGGDQAAVPVTAGSKTISLNFKAGTGSVQ